jgi:hypothetical protein
MNNYIVKPAILYRLFCEKSPQKAVALCTQLAEALDLKFSGINNTWSHPGYILQLKCRDLDLNDSLIIEIIWNNRDMDHFWQHASEIIHKAVRRILSQTEERSTAGNMLIIRGTTLIYQASIPSDVDLNKLTCEKIMENEGFAYCHPGYSQVIPGGKLWLLTIPQENQKEFTYLSLSSSSEKDKDLLVNELFDLAFIQRDLIVHKAFQCGRNYHQILRHHNIDQAIWSLTDSTKQVLDELDVLSETQNKRLMNLARDFDTLLEASLELEIQKTSLAQQQANYQYLAGENPPGKIDNFLNLRITRFHHELTLKAEQCCNLLNGAEKATHISQTRINEVKEQRKQRQEFWLAFLGIALAVPQIFTYETVDRLLSFYHLSLNSPAILLVQITSTVLIASFLAGSIWAFSKLRRKKR